ncbi:MAG TPA: hypothetical protein PLS01_06160, partial [Clostridia bacterium]|nr:hypothetical protein [Clostridia bacterium]
CQQQPARLAGDHPVRQKGAAGKKFIHYLTVASMRQFLIARSAHNKRQGWMHEILYAGSAAKRAGDDRNHTACRSNHFKELR